MDWRKWWWAAGLVGLAIGGPTASRGDDWTQWGGGLERNLVSRETGIPTAFHPGKKKRDRLGFDPATGST